jgi:hypothetical protein
VSLFKRGKYWYYDFWFDGIRHRTSTKQRDEHEAEKIQNAVKIDLARHKSTLPSTGPRFSELCDRYMEVARTKLKPAYVAGTYRIARHLRAHFGQLFVCAINRDACEKYRRKRLSAGATNATMYLEFSVLTAILKFALQSDLARESLGKHARRFTDGDQKKQQRRLS